MTHIAQIANHFLRRNPRRSFISGRLGVWGGSFGFLNLIYPGGQMVPFMRAEVYNLYNSAGFAIMLHARRILKSSS
jgi:hypothetical protein